MKFNIVYALGEQAYLIQTPLYILSYAVAMTCLCRTAVTCAKEFHLASQILFCGGIMAVFSFNIPALISNFLLGAFLGLLLNRCGGLLLCFFYTVIYRAIFIAIDLYSYRAEKTYGQMMTGLSIAGMFCLFMGTALLFVYLADSLAQKRKMRVNVQTMFVLLGSVLLIIIGCATTQYANM
ncbi:MAG: hypothetical protein HFE77_06740 [Clostridiales bacterium]|nr:hypothetical protein [Clostridiales bacterium]